MIGKPLGSGPLRSCIWKRVDLISSREGMDRSSSFSSSIMQGKTKWSRWIRKWMSFSLKRFLKFSRKSCLISFEFVIHVPFLGLIASMLFLLLRIMVERWKNLEFLSPSLSHSSLDFWRQRASLLINHSNNSNCNHILVASFFWDGGLSWTCLIF